MNTTIDDRPVTTPGQAVSAEEREALRESVADLIRRRGGMDTVRAASTRPGRTDESLWATLCAEIGVAALPKPGALLTMNLTAVAVS